ncbi:MAG: hypothetical protein IKI29_01940 [Clostridia bacterium]|nr:hypothetical protein [Clostridia bacterium]
MEENRTETESTISSAVENAPQESEPTEHRAAAPQETVPQSPETAPHSAEPDEKKGEETSSAETNPSFLTVQFNHKARDLSKEDAVRYAQKGMLFDRVSAELAKINPIFNKLDYLAAQKDTSPEALVDQLIREQESDYKKGLTEKFGEQLDDETAEQLLQLFRQKQKTKYEKILSDREKSTSAKQEAQESDESRIARQFTQLQREFPEYETFKALPEPVKKDAFEGADLLTAMLLFEHQAERQKRQTAAAKQSAAHSSTGSQTAKGESESSVERSFASGLWRRG